MTGFSLQIKSLDITHPSLRISILLYRYNHKRQLVPQKQSSRSNPDRLHAVACRTKRISKMLQGRYFILPFSSVTLKNYHMWRFWYVTQVKRACVLILRTSTTGAGLDMRSRNASSAKRDIHAQISQKIILCLQFYCSLIMYFYNFPPASGTFVYSDMLEAGIVHQEKHSMVKQLELQI